MRLPLLLTAAALLHVAAPDPGTDRPVVVTRVVHDSMNAVFTRSNEHWNELQDVNTLTQMLGTDKPTQREFLGCLQGELRKDTLWVDQWTPARNMKQLQFAVTGDCDGLPRLVGTFHTHPFRAEPETNKALKEPELSRQDLTTFSRSTDLVSMALWDADSADVAVKSKDGEVIHPATLIVR
ncbi:MAG: hypothetical protein ABJD11_12560 [Gemmatimonadota bacterium]